MQRLIVAVMVIALAGCSTLRPVAGTAPELQERIASGAVLKPGDRVRITTADSHIYEFAVTAIRDDAIEGKGVAVPLAQVATVKKRYTSTGKTALLVGVIVLAGLGTAAATAGPPKINLGGQF